VIGHCSTQKAIGSGELYVTVPFFAGELDGVPVQMFLSLKRRHHSCCRLLNHFFPQCIANVQAASSYNLRKQTIALFLLQAQKQFCLHPNDLFTVMQLADGLPDPFSQVLHTILVMARAVRPEEEYLENTPSQLKQKRVHSEGFDRPPSLCSSSYQESSASESVLRPRKHPSSSPTKHSNSPNVERKSHISFSAHDIHLEGSRKAARFYGLDRRLSDTAVN